MINPIVKRQLNLMDADFWCNDGRNGMFTKELSGITWDRENCIDLVHFHSNGQFKGIHIAFPEPHYMKIGKIKIHYFRKQTSMASWCGETITIQKKEFARILNYLKKRKVGYLQSAYSELWEKWEKEDFEFKEESL